MPDSTAMRDGAGLLRKTSKTVTLGVSYEISSGALMQITIRYRSRYLPTVANRLLPYAGLGEALLPLSIEQAPVLIRFSIIFCAIG